MKPRKREREIPPISRMEEWKVGKMEIPPFHLSNFPIFQHVEKLIKNLKYYIE
jgi:hypothetical protein